MEGVVAESLLVKFWQWKHLGNFKHLWTRQKQWCHFSPYSMTKKLSFDSQLASVEMRIGSLWALLQNTTSRHLFSVPLVYFHMNSVSLIFIHLFGPLKLNIEYPSQVSLCTRKVRQLDYTSYNQRVFIFFISAHHFCKNWTLPETAGWMNKSLKKSSAARCIRSIWGRKLSLVFKKKKSQED